MTSWFSFQAASLNIIHVPDSQHSAAARILFQYLLTSQGDVYELKVGHHHLTVFQSRIGRAH